MFFMLHRTNRKLKYVCLLNSQYGHYGHNKYFLIKELDDSLLYAQNTIIELYPQEV